MKYVKTSQNKKKPSLAQNKLTWTKQNKSYLTNNRYNDVQQFNLKITLAEWRGGLPFPDWSPLLPYMAVGTAHYAEKVGDTQQIVTGSLKKKNQHDIKYPNKV